jgi:peptidoglycan/xylan/chitin deacetylase (PgdA/CDA1 family)
MDFFISKNMSFAASLLWQGRSEYLSYDSRVLDKVKEGVDKGLFEIAIHGYTYVNYSIMTKEEQKR